MSAVEFETRKTTYRILFNMCFLDCHPQKLILFRSRVVIGPIKSKPPVDQTKKEEVTKELTRAVDHIADYFLQDRPYIIGDEISVADILGVCELHMLKCVCQQGVYEGNAKVKAWVDRVAARLQPHYDEATKGVKALAKMYKEAEESETTQI